MFAFFDRYQSVVLSVFLVFYIINSIYISSTALSFILIILMVMVQVIYLRKKIQQLSFIQLLSLFCILAGSLAGLYLSLVWLNHLTETGIMPFSDWMIIVAKIILILVFLIAGSSVVQNLYIRYSTSKV
jgi:TRAP-type uncharacterized transport system fused permease subunit